MSVVGGWMPRTSRACRLIASRARTGRPFQTTASIIKKPPAGLSTAGAGEPPPEPFLFDRKAPAFSESPIRDSQSTAKSQPIIELTDDGIILSFNKSPDKSQHYPSFWLRDHCPCTECTHWSTKQRQIDTNSIPTEVQIRSARARPDGLEIHWFTAAEHVSLYPWTWLQTYAPFSQPPTSRLRPVKYLHPATDPSTYPAVRINAITTTTTGLHAYIEAIHTYGLCFAPDTPVTTEATETLLNTIAFIRPTHYGAFWDFTSVANPTDTAYTTLPLPCHTDTTYFTDPCGLQMFHCLSHTDGSGGESMFVDGFLAAAHLFSTDPEAYEILSTVPIVSHASGDEKAGVIVNNGAKMGYPVFNHINPSSPSLAPTNLSQIRWNNDDRHPSTTFSSPAQMRAWYSAARKWSEILRMPEFEIEVKLQPGNPVIFDNWRVLHGRRSFTGKRRMCGGYVGMDDFLGRLRGLDRAVEGELR